MNKKGNDYFALMIGIILVLLVATIIYIIFIKPILPTVAKATACESQGGVCRSICYDDELDLHMVGKIAGCSDTERCCKGSAIKEATKCKDIGSTCDIEGTQICNIAGVCVTKAEFCNLNDNKVSKDNRIQAGYSTYCTTS